MKVALEVKELVKKYDDGFKLGEVDLRIPNGCIVGLIGENGAGKTTLIKSILNIIKFDKGEVKIFGQNILENEDLIKEEIGVVLDNMFFPELLTPKDIDLVMKDIFKKWDSNLFNKYISTFELPIKQRIKDMSEGMRKKLEIATALSHHPKLLILDEPTSGLDPVVRNEVLDIFFDFIQDEEHTIILSTHITSDLEHIADKIIFIDKGKILFDKTRDEVLDNYGVLKVDSKMFQKIDEKDIISFKKNRYDYEILIENRTALSKKYKTCIIDKITLEELMVFMIKGEKINNK